MWRSICLGIALMAFVASAASAQQARVSVEQYPQMVVVYIHDFDLLLDESDELVADVNIGGRAYNIDLTAQYQQPALVFRKAGPERIPTVSVAITADGQRIFNEDINAGQVHTPEPAIELADEEAFIEPGNHMGGAPVIRQPRLDNLPQIELAAAVRRVDFNEIAARAESDINFPIVSANNNCAISRQTDFPGDPSRRSVYVPLKSQLYNQETGQADIVMHYLAEIPLDPDWLTGPDHISLDPDEIKVHTTSTLWPTDDERGRYLTGTGSGGLGQLVGGMTVDDDGNIYFSTSMPNLLVRFNVARGEWENPPINIVQFINKFLPDRDEMPEDLRQRGARFDNGFVISAEENSIFFGPRRYAAYGMVYMNGVFSFPLDNWNDAEAFERNSHFLAGSWPTAENALYDTWPEPGVAARTIHAGFYHDGAYYFPSYSKSPGGPWRIELNPDGSAAGISEITAGEYARAGQQRPTPEYPEAASGLINWWDYGVLETTRAQLARVLGAQAANGNAEISVQYDAISAMMLDPERYATLLDNIAGPSLAPCYMAVGIPDNPGHILGVGEYGYYLADLNIAGAEGGLVRKEYLKLGDDDEQSDLPVKIGLGPYGHIWYLEGNERYIIMPGYTGISRMLYSVDGEPLSHHSTEMLRMSNVSLDGAPTGGMKRIQCPHHGLDGKIFLTGTHTADRGGTAYSTGLMVFDAMEADEIYRLSGMSRSSNTGYMRVRLIHETDGSKRQEIVLAGGRSNEAYINDMDPLERPENRDAKIFLYDYEEGNEPRDLFGFSMPVVDGNSGAAGQVFSRNRRYLLTHTHGSLLVFDMETRQYVNGGRLPGSAIRFARPFYRFTIAPDDRIFLAVAVDNTLTFYEVDVEPNGNISMAPHLAIDAPDNGALQPLNDAVIAFVADPAGDGSYDLAIGPSSRASGTTMWIVSDFISARK